MNLVLQYFGKVYGHLSERIRGVWASHFRIFGLILGPSTCLLPSCHLCSTIHHRYPPRLPFLLRLGNIVLIRLRVHMIHLLRLL